MLLLLHGRLARSGNQRLLKPRIDFLVFFRLSMPRRSTVPLSTTIPAARCGTISQNVQSDESRDPAVCFPNSENIGQAFSCELPFYDAP
jgi:hypothetical protein